MKLLSLSKKIILFIFLLFFLTSVSSEDSVDIWNKKNLNNNEDASPTKQLEKNKSISNIQLTNKKNDINEIQIDSALNENNNYVYYKSFLERSLHVSNMNLSCTLFKKETIDSFGGCNKKIFCPDYFVELMMSSRGPFIESKNLIFFNPFEDKNRISQNETQILHDLNYALEEFFLLNEKLSNLYGKKSLKRAASRQLNYIKKYVWKEISFDVLFHYILASLKVIKVDKNNFSKTRLAFKNIKHPNGLKD